MDLEIPVTGNVGHIEIDPRNNVMWSTDQPLNADQAEITVGIVVHYNTTSKFKTPILVRSCVGDIVRAVLIRFCCSYVCTQVIVCSCVD